MANVHSLQPRPNHTRANLWQLQYPVAYAQCVPAVLGPHEVVQLVTQRAREALNDQRETARRALLHQQREFFAAAHPHEVAARQNLVNTLTRNNEAHNYNVQVQVRQLENKKHTRFFSKSQGTIIAILSGSTSSFLKISEKFGVTGGETSKHMIYVQNLVFRQHTRETLRNNKVKNTQDNNST